MSTISYHYRQLTKAEGLWVSIPHEAPEGARGEMLMRQGVIGGHLFGEPRCAIAESGFFYALGADGKQIDRQQALEIGLIEMRHLETEETFNERLVTEVRFCGYPQFDAAIKACDVKLSPRIGKLEVEVLAKMEAWHGRSMPDVSKALLFGRASDGMSKNELAALVKLVRRDLIKIYRMFENGYVLRFEVSKGDASC